MLFTKNMNLTRCNNDFDISFSLVADVDWLCSILCTCKEKEQLEIRHDF